MKRIQHLLLALIVSLIGTFSMQAQVISFNTQTLGTNYNGANGQAGITFVIQNTNGYPAVLTGVSNLINSTGSGNFELWYSSTNLSNTPGIIGSPGWTLAASSTAVPYTTGIQNSLFPALNFVIPGNTTYRFFISSPGVTIQYSDGGVGLASPTTFSNTGVNILTADALISGQGVGYGGPISGPTFYPRAFTGTLTFNLLSTPCAGTPSAGTAAAAPLSPCPGQSINLSLTGVTSAANLTFQWLRSTTGNPGTWIPLGGANTNPYNYTPPVGSTTYYRCVVTCLNSSLFDTSSVVGPIATQPWSPTSPCYCTSGATSTGYEYVSNFTLGSLNNSTDCINPLAGSQGTGTGTPNQYTDFTGVGGVPAPIAYVGLPTPFSVGIGTCSGPYASSVAIFIDYNHNANFSDPGEMVYSNGSVATMPIVLAGSFTAPGTALPGVTRMRITVVEGSGVAITPCLSYLWGETEDYLINIIPPSPFDPAITSMTSPAGNCYSAAQVITAQLCNFGTTPIDLSVNPVTVTLNVTGPNGITPYTTTVSTGLLNAFGASCVTAIFTGVNMYTGGSYSLNTTLTIAGLTNGLLSNDSLATPITKLNYRPTAGAPYQLCQYSPIPFGQGLTVSGCATPINDSAIITFQLEPTSNPTAISPTGAAYFAKAVLPNLPLGSTIGSCEYKVTNLATLGSGWALETRFPLFYGGMPVQAANVLYPSILGNPSTTIANYTWLNNSAALSNAVGLIYATLNAGDTLKMGYHSTWSGNSTSNGYTLNAGANPTVATLKIYYTYVPASFEWYSAPTGGVNLYSFTPFNPLITTGSGISNSNVPGTTTFFAACAGSSNCRVPVSLNINPVPVVIQDTLALCESSVGSNSAIFDLTTMNGAVSAFAPGVLVEYYGDQGLFSAIQTPTMDTTSTNFVYSKVSILATGCSSSDSLLLQVNGQPEFPSPIVTGFACAPASIDVASLINPFSTVPAGADTLYYSDPAYTIPHPNPHSITTQDTIYMVFASNTMPVCSDSAIAYVDILAADNKITAQDAAFNYSIPGYYGCISTTLMDGISDTIRSSVDCRRVSSVTDITNSISLGNVSTCLDVAASIPYHNGQPYSARTYQITAATSDTAMVCLYYLNDDFELYNADATFYGWPLLPTAATMPANMGNIAITKVDMGDLNTPGHMATAIPNSAINANYDPISTVWTVCFPVSGFSYFYLHTQNANNTPLPVNMVSFTGKKVEATSSLSWTTLTEQNNSHFVVERSKDGKSYSRLSDNIATKAVNGNSSEKLDYNFTDATPYQGHNYYRLQQNDIDGKASYSKVVDIYFGNETLVTLYPNPVSSNLHIDINTPKATVATLKVMDATGRTVKVVEMQLQEGNNTTSVDMQGLADGVYMINITNAKGLNYSQPVRKN